MKITGIVAVAMIAASAASAQTELRFGHVGEPGSLFEASANHFVEVANEKLGDEYEVVAYGASQLGGDQELLQKLKLGQVTFALPSSVMSSVAPEFGVFEMPYIIQDREHIKAVEEAMLEDTFNVAAEREGYRILAFWENGFRHITNNVRPINTPEDLQGVKLRTPQGEWRVKMFQTYGANPTPMAFSDVFTALQTGVIDGQENPYAQIASAKFQEVQDYLSITGHVYTPAYVLVSENHFGQLPEDVQQRADRGGAGNPGLRLRARGAARGGASAGDQGRRRRGERGGQAGLHRRLGADLRGVREPGRRRRRAGQPRARGSRRRRDELRPARRHAPPLPPFPRHRRAGTGPSCEELPVRSDGCSSGS